MGVDFRAYFDDSGEKEYGAKTSRYFVYAGALVRLDDETALSREIADLKIATFGTADVEIKSNWVRIPSERKARYLDPYGVADGAFRAFIDALKEMMTSERFTYVAAAIDKIQMQERYGERKWYPSATAYQFLLQRVQLHCAAQGAKGHITIDDMSGSSPKKNQWRDLLRTHHNRLRKDGCQLTKLKFDNIAPEPRFASSKRLHLLQVADLVAYDVFRQFRDHGDRWDDPGARGVPVYGHLRPLLKRFMLGPGGKIEGWGIVKWPNDVGSRWRVRLP